MKKPCACCSGIRLVTPEPEYNRPGLSALSYRVRNYATFLESMLARLSTVYVDADPLSPSTSRIYPLKALTTREPSDPSIALLDAWAIVADVLTFYQERIANEGYLATATERLSLLELARLIGYRPRPGVAASVFLAFTTSTGFSGEIPAGTRAQSIPGAGETAQYFETGTKLVARDTWNSLGPRLTRPQVIAPPPDPRLKLDNHLGTNANIVDSIYFQGIATNLKAGDPLLLVLSNDPNQQFLRFAEQVDAQADQSRTVVALKESPAAQTGLKFVPDVLERFIYDAPNQFAGSDLAANTAALLSDILTNVPNVPVAAAISARAALAQIQAFHDVAVKRRFTRVERWLQHLLDILPSVVSTLQGSSTQTVGIQAPALPSVTFSSLERLGALLPRLSVERSVAPVSPLRVNRSIAASFASHSDTIPRLIAALNPVAAPVIYDAWGNVQPVHIDLEIYALRAKASLFASNFAGASQIVPTQAAGGTTTTISFTPASIANAWGDLISGKSTSLAQIALDAVYDKITADSWVAIDQPVFDKNDSVVDRKISYHKVVEIRTETLDTTHGFSAKVSVLTLDTNWITGANTDAFTKLTGQPLLLRSTIVYAQTEPLVLAEEPLDRDVEGDSIELDGLYDGLEPGRWIIVSGERTDIPNVAGVNASELVIISAVTQGAGKQACLPFLPKFVPFESLLYISDENSDGDRLVVGVPSGGLPALLKEIPLPDETNQQFCEPIQLCPGIYADAYIPTQNERDGNFQSFAGQLLDPASPKNRFPGGVIPGSRLNSVFAWRIRRLTSGSETVHTTIQFARALSYKYNTAGIQIYANVAKATHGQTTGEILGDGDGSQPFQRFALHQKPLTYVSAPTAAGAQSTLTVRVNDIEWHEAGDIASLAPSDRKYITQTDDSDQTSVIFGNGEHGARVPTGSSNIKATYRTGIGSAGNVAAGQISQLATHPLGPQGVINPLPATGGADRDTLDQVRRNAPLAVLALDRLVSVQDYADFARTYAGIAKTSAVQLSDGRRQLVHLTIAGVNDIPIDQSSDLYQNLFLSLQNFGDPSMAIQVCVRRVRLLVISAGVQLQPDYLWDAVEPKIRAAVVDGFSFDARDLGQSAFLSEAIAMMQAVEGVLYVDVRLFDAVPENTSIKDFAKLAATLKRNQFVNADLARIDTTAPPVADPCTRIRAAEVVYLTPEIPDTLILTDLGA
jgi:hypothetical protein